MIENLKNGFTLMLYGIFGVFVVLLIFYTVIKLFAVIDSKAKKKKSQNDSDSRIYSER